MLGVIHHMKETYGFIKGEDGKSRFFIPTGLQLSTLKFENLKVGMAVEFTHIDHPKGARAIEVRVRDERVASGY